MPDTAPPFHDSKLERRKPAPQEVRLTDETIEYLHQQMRDAVRTGIKEAVQDFKDETTRQAGDIIMGGLWGLLKKFVIFVMFAGFFYAVGGWHAVVGFFKTLFMGGA